jgi:hypothetical protein
MTVPVPVTLVPREEGMFRIPTAAQISRAPPRPGRRSVRGGEVLTHNRCQKALRPRFVWRSSL